MHEILYQIDNDPPIRHWTAVLAAACERAEDSGDLVEIRRDGALVTRVYPITDEQIRALGCEAHAHSDYPTVDLCERALTRDADAHADQDGLPVAYAEISQAQARALCLAVIVEYRVGIQ